MAKLRAVGFSLALIVGATMAAPAGAIREFSPKWAMPGGSFGLADAVHSVDDKSTPDRLAKGSDSHQAVAGAVEQANWLMIVAGFGLLGAMNRRSDLDRLRDEMVL